MTRSGLAIELTRPFTSGAFSVTDLSVALPEVSFPIDLSKGVKQFRHHRGQLSHLTVELDLQKVESFLVSQLSEILGAPLLGARVRPSGLPSPSDLNRSGSPGTAVSAPSLPSNSQPSIAPGVLSVGLFGQDRALCFDLVLSSHRSPEVVVDGARGFGLDSAPLSLTLRLLEGLLGGSDLAVVRRGRSFELAEVTRRLCLLAFPPLGFRVPAVPGPVHFGATAERGMVRLTIKVRPDLIAEEHVISPRAVRLSGLAALVGRADDELALGNRDVARGLYLEALEVAPAQPDVLCSIAELDAYTKGRAQSALGLLAEVRFGGTSESTELVALLLRARALREGLRQELFLETLREAAAREPDAALRAILHCAISERLEEPTEVRAELDAAVSACPRHPLPRWMRFQINLEARETTGAEIDAEQLDAAARDPAERAATAGKLGQLFEGAGHFSSAIRWLQRALNQKPDDGLLQITLASVLQRTGRELEAAELYQSGLSRIAEDAARGNGALIDHARLSLGRILAQRAGDARLGLGYLRQIGSRSAHAVEARTLEAKLALQLGEDALRRSAWLRLLEAVELGWIETSEVHELLVQIERDERARGEGDVADFALSLLRSDRVETEVPS